MTKMMDNFSTRCHVGDDSEVQYFNGSGLVTHYLVRDQSMCGGDVQNNNNNNNNNNSSLTPNVTM